MASCQTCEYYFPDKESRGETGSCRRYPPSKTSEFVTVSPNYWCGEFQLKPELQRKQMKQLLMESGMKHDAKKYFGDI